MATKKKSKKPNVLDALAGAILAAAGGRNTQLLVVLPDGRKVRVIVVPDEVKA